MKLRYLLPLFLICALAVSVVTVWLAMRLTGALDSVAQAQDRRFESIVLADELRQSSDDLTRFARMFVQTGDERFVASTLGQCWLSDMVKHLVQTGMRVSFGIGSLLGTSIFLKLALERPSPFRTA